MQLPRMAAFSRSVAVHILSAGAHLCHGYRDLDRLVIAILKALSDPLSKAGVGSLAAINVARRHTRSPAIYTADC